MSGKFLSMPVFLAETEDEVGGGNGSAFDYLGKISIIQRHRQVN